MKIVVLIVEICFWLSVFAVFHTYVFFPVILKLLARNKSNNNFVWNVKDVDSFPSVTIVMAAYNEEPVIEQKIKSVISCNYPNNKIEFLIGSDNSTDKTNEIVLNYSERFPFIKLIAFTERQGKACIINKLAEMASGEILILTDANVIFTETTIYQLIKHYKNDKIHLVGGLILNTNLKKDGISYQEKAYLSNENLIKFREGVLWGTMIGAFGGVYSIRKYAYKPVPLNYFMDDFYITMHVIKDGGSSIQELEAVCYEDISNLIKEEFRRKIRISVGNFQNLSTFKRLAFPVFSGRGFSFISHKILRWHTPFLLITCLCLSAFLAFESQFYLIVFTIQVLMLCSLLLDAFLKLLKINFSLLRFLTHFYSMNLALLIGFFKYHKGVESSVWQPTKRNQ